MSRFRKFLVGLTLSSLLVLIIGMPPGWAQSTAASSPTANVVIDGRVLFRVGSIHNFSAEQRANSANADLQRALRTTPSETQIPVNIVQRDLLTTIRVNNRHLLTVTDGDFMVGVTPKEQAQEWAEILQSALARAQEERLPGHRREMGLRLLAALVGLVMLYSLVHWIRRRLWRQRFQKKRRLQPVPYAQKLVQPLLLGMQASTGLAFLWYAGELLPKVRIARYRIFQFLEQTFNSALLTVGEKTYSVLDLFKLVVLLALLWAAVRALSMIIKSSFLQAAISDRGAQDAIATVIQVVLMVVGTFYFAASLGH